MKKKHLILPTFAAVFMLSLICGCSDKGNAEETTAIKTSANTIVTSVTSVQKTDQAPSTESPIVTTTTQKATDVPTTTVVQTVTDAPITTAKPITTTVQKPSTQATSDEKKPSQSDVTTTRRGETPFVPAH